MSRNEIIASSWIANVEYIKQGKQSKKLVKFVLDFSDNHFINNQKHLTGIIHMMYGPHDFLLIISDDVIWIR